MEGSSLSNMKTNIQGLGLGHSRTLTLPRQLHHPSSASPAAPLLRFPSHSSWQTHSRSRSSSSSPCSSSSLPSSRPPSPMLKALHEALTDSILPSPPPPARLASSPTPSHSLSRPPPLISSLRFISPSATPPSTSDSPVILTLSSSPSLAAPVSSTRSSLETLRSIHTSTIQQIPPSPSLRRWWFQSDSDTSKELSSVLNEPDLLDGNLGRKCTSSSCYVSLSNWQTSIP
jgi:triacylglycerol lipase